VVVRQDPSSSPDRRKSRGTRAAKGPDTLAPSAKVAGQLSRAVITDGAIEFIERRGIDQLSMRALALELGCGTMSLYTHVRNRDDLIASIVEELQRKSASPSIAAQAFASWQEVITSVHLAYRDLAVKYPRSFELLALAPYDVAPVAGSLETLVSSLCRAGLPQDRAYEVLGAIDAYATGFLTVWARTEVGQKESDAQASSHLKALRRLDVFERGLRVFIEGFEREFEVAKDAQATASRRHRGG
jgi:AcrR family transcriptional regulator